MGGGDREARRRGTVNGERSTVNSERKGQELVILRNEMMKRNVRLPAEIWFRGR